MWKLYCDYAIETLNFRGGMPKYLGVYCLDVWFTLNGSEREKVIVA